MKWLVDLNNGTGSKLDKYVSTSKQEKYSKRLVKRDPSTASQQNSAGLLVGMTERESPAQDDNRFPVARRIGSLIRLEGASNEVRMIKEE
jgi:hypothetical protein